MKLDLDKWRAELKKVESEIRMLKKRINSRQERLQINATKWIVRNQHVVPRLDGEGTEPVSALVWKLLHLKAKATILYCMRRAAKDKRHGPNTFWYYAVYEYGGRKNEYLQFNYTPTKNGDEIVLKGIVPEFEALLVEEKLDGMAST